MLVDSHCHIPSKLYRKTPQEVVDAALGAGVTKLISIGTSLVDNEKAAEVARSFDNVFSTIAVYPHDDRNLPLETLTARLKSQVDTLGTLRSGKGKIVAIGECGVDISNWANGRPVDEQLALFEMQIKLALDTGLPLIIHNRNGDAQVLDLLKKYVPAGLRGVMHCFASTWEYAQKILELGFYVSFSGMITYTDKEHLLEVVKNVPLNKFLIETDSPYLVPASHKGEVNEPKYVKIVAEKVVQVKEETFDTIARASSENTSALFGL